MCLIEGNMFLPGLLILIAITRPAFSAVQASVSNTISPTQILLPKEIHTGKTISLAEGVHILVSGRDAEDGFAAKDLKQFHTSEDIPQSNRPPAFRGFVLDR